MIRCDPFDPALAESSTAVVTLERIIDPLGRIQHDLPRIEMYRTAMRAGDRFPPISVVRWGARFLVADGHKRLTAYLAFGAPVIRVEIWSWGRWLRDQGRQVNDNVRKNGRILQLSVTDPNAAWQLLRTTLEHWSRVARSLRASLSGTLPSARPPAGSDDPR